MVQLLEKNNNTRNQGSRTGTQLFSLLAQWRPHLALCLSSGVKDRHLTTIQYWLLSITMEKFLGGFINMLASTNSALYSSCFPYSVIPSFNLFFILFFFKAASQLWFVVSLLSFHWDRNREWFPYKRRKSQVVVKKKKKKVFCLSQSQRRGNKNCYQFGTG